jgi:hypothetical protein
MPSPRRSRSEIEDKEGDLGEQHPAFAEQRSTAPEPQQSPFRTDASDAPAADDVDGQRPGPGSYGMTTGQPAVEVSVQRSDPKRGLVRAPTLRSSSEAKRQRRLKSDFGDAGVDVVTTDDSEMPAAGQMGQPRDVVLRIEFIKSGEMKLLSFLMAVSLLAGIAVTAYFKVR